MAEKNKDGLSGLPVGSFFRGLGKEIFKGVARSATDRVLTVAEGMAAKAIGKITEKKDELQPMIDAAITGLKERGSGDSASILSGIATTMIENAERFIGPGMTEVVKEATIIGIINFLIDCSLRELEARGELDEKTKQQLAEIQESLLVAREATEEAGVAQAAAVKPPEKRDQQREKIFSEIIKAAEEVREPNGITDIFRQLWEIGADRREQDYIFSKLRIKGLGSKILNDGWKLYCSSKREVKDAAYADEQYRVNYEQAEKIGKPTDSPLLKDLMVKKETAYTALEKATSEYQAWLDGITGEQKT